MGGVNDGTMRGRSHSGEHISGHNGSSKDLGKKKNVKTPSEIRVPTNQEERVAEPS